MTNNSPNSFDIKPLSTPDGDDEAERRFNDYKSLDPFPEIIPSLLNSADIYDYVRVTGMLCPFDPKKLKSASYAVPILGTLIYWDEKGDKHEDDLKLNQEFTLKANSIAFVSIEPKFRLPDYIALRFNLKITHIHRGILLGTGPLVDPGYVGKLLIPLHNLTTNDYTFRGGEDLIWMEFTKLSDNSNWENKTGTSKQFVKVGTLIRYSQIPKIPRLGEYVPFPSKKSQDDVRKFLDKASPHRPIRSSIPDIIVQAQKSAQNAEQKAEDATKTAESIKNFITLAGGSSLVVVAITLGALFFQIFSVIQDSMNYVKNTNDVKKEYEEKIINLEENNQKLNQEINNLKNSIVELQKSIDNSSNQKPQ